MKRKIFIAMLILTSIPLIATVLGADKKSAPVMKPSKQAVKPAPSQTMRKPGLPDQPRCDMLALPDISIEKFQYSGPAGAFKPSQQYSISVVLKNTGQCQTGEFLVTLQVRIQSPQNGVDDVVTIGQKKVNSIPPAKTGASTGTATVTFDYTTANYSWAQYNFTAIADSTQHIQEWDEANNEKTGIDQIVDTNR